MSTLNKGNNMINPFAKVDMVKHAGRVVAVDAEGNILATAKEKRSLKYDKSIKAFILCIPELDEVKPKQITRIALVLDESSSMSGIKPATLNVFNSILDSIKEQSAKNNQETTVSFYTFATTVRNRFKNRDIESVKPLTSLDFNPNGWTSLLDSIGVSITDFKNENNTNIAYLIYVVTDGEENWSKTFSNRDIQLLLCDCQNLGNFTFTISVPPKTKNNFCSKYNIPPQNVIEWEATNEGIKQLGVKTTSGVASYYTARSLGKTAVSNFFVNTDLSQVTQKDLKALKDLSSSVKIYKVPKESVIKDFVEEKTKKPYIIGQAYYELTKKETIQPQKSIMVQCKKSKKVYSGEQARDLLSLPKGINAKVEVGNHAGYRVFAQSTSVNRKLVRGSHVLLDLTKSTNSNPTWS